MIEMEHGRTVKVSKPRRVQVEVERRRGSVLVVVGRGERGVSGDAVLPDIIDGGTPYETNGA